VKVVATYRDNILSRDVMDSTPIRHSSGLPFLGVFFCVCSVSRSNALLFIRAFPYESGSVKLDGSFIQNLCTFFRNKKKRIVPVLLQMVWNEPTSKLRLPGPDTYLPMPDGTGGTGMCRDSRFFLAGRTIELDERRSYRIIRSLDSFE